MSEYVTVEAQATDDEDVLELVTNQTLTLDGDEVRQRQDFVEVGEGKPVPSNGTSGQGITPHRV